jgi:hypothetical protein
MEVRSIPRKALKSIVVLIVIIVAAMLWGVVARAMGASSTLITLGAVAISGGILMRAYSD